jgi:hypothetical protein
MLIGNVREWGLLNLVFEYCSMYTCRSKSCHKNLDKSQVSRFTKFSYYTNLRIAQRSTHENL